MVGAPLQPVSENPDSSGKTKRVIDLPILHGIYVVYNTLSFGDLLWV